MNHVYILLGSNINPNDNIFAAINILDQRIGISAKSDIWQTKAYGANGPDFYNIALLLITDLSLKVIKNSYLKNIEHELGRVREKDIYAPRTIDLDVIIFNELVVDSNLWTHNFIATPMAQLLPNLIHPTSGESLNNIAERLNSCSPAKRVANRKFQNSKGFDPLDI